MKSQRQFRADIASGYEWETQLHRCLAQYLYGLAAPRQNEVVDGVVLGGFDDGPDMQVATSVEAKIRLSASFRFTDAASYPFPTVIVNEVYKTRPDNMTVASYMALPLLDQLALMRPFHSYWIASSDRLHVAVVTPATKHLWRQERMISRKDRRAAINWVCPREAVLFGRFPADVKYLLTRM